MEEGRTKRNWRKVRGIIKIGEESGEGKWFGGRVGGGIRGIEGRKEEEEEEV